MTLRLRPRDGHLYVVRWLRLDGSEVKHRYFRRRHDADRLAGRLAAGGWTVAVCVTGSTWTPLDEEVDQ